MGRHDQWQFSLRVESLSDSSSDEDEPAAPQPNPSQPVNLGERRSADRARPTVTRAQAKESDFWYAKQPQSTGGMSAKLGSRVGGGEDEAEWDVVREIEEQEQRERLGSKGHHALGGMPNGECRYQDVDVCELTGAT